MVIRKDPEGKEAAALNEMVDLSDLEILEVGCGDGRLTWHIAENALQVTAIDPDADDIEIARSSTPGELKPKIQFVQSSLEEFSASHVERKFDLAIFSWSL